MSTSPGSIPEVPTDQPSDPGESPSPLPPSSTDGGDDDGDDTPTPTSVPTQPPEETSTPPEVPTTSSLPPEEPTTSSAPPPETTTSEPPPETTTTPPEEPTTSTQPPETTSIPEETTSEVVVPSTTEVVESTVADSTATSIVTITTTRGAPEADPTTTGQTGEPTPINPGSGGGGGGLDSGAKIAIGVVVPIVSIAIIALVGLFFWKKRRARRAAEEERRKEVEDYSYNPNADPTIPNVMGGGSGDAGYEMREDSSGYRGWGTTAAGSTGRKASTTMSGGGLAYSDAQSPTQAHASLARSDEVYSPEGEILGAMGPAAANNRGTGVNRGPSNASSSYSAANRSDNSDGAISYGNGATYYDQQAHNPYADNYAGGGGGPQELSAAPVIRDNPARRNTRIENPSHYPQQSAGISQNF